MSKQRPRVAPQPGHVMSVYQGFIAQPEPAVKDTRLAFSGRAKAMEQPPIPIHLLSLPPCDRCGGRDWALAEPIKEGGEPLWLCTCYWTWYSCWGR